MKKIILGSLFFLLSGCALITSRPSEEPQGINRTALINPEGYFNQASDNQNINEAQTSGQTSKIDCQSQTINEKTSTYTISAQYPACNLADDNKKQVLNEEVAKFIKNEVSSFKESLAEWPGPLAGILSTFDTNYKIETANQRLISLDFTIDTYFNGAAHPNLYFLVFNYDLNKMSKIKLADIFLANAKYLDKLSAMCKTNFTQKFSDLWFSEGCDPREESFSNFVILNSSLKFLIDPYQVAPYAAGPQELVINYTDLNGLLDTSGILTNIIK